MTTKLTEADEIELKTARYESIFGDYQDKDHVTVSRWSKKGDRLYINDDSKIEKHSVYVDLESETVEGLPSDTMDSSVEIDGETATVSIDWSGKEREFVLALECDEETVEDDNKDTDDEGTDVNDEDDNTETPDNPTYTDDNGDEWCLIPEYDEATDDTDPEIATDGGEDHSDIATDGQIRQAIQDRGTEEMTLESVRDALAAVERDLADYIEEFDDHGVIGETDDACIYADTEGVELDRAMDDAGIDDETMRGVLDLLMHDLADVRCDYDWSSHWPVVIRKSGEFRQGTHHTERTIEDLLYIGLSPAEALDYYACEIRGRSQAEWGEVRDVTRGSVHKNIRQAREIMREQY